MRGVIFRKATFRLILVFLYIFIQLEESTFDGGETEREKKNVCLLSSEIKSFFTCYIVILIDIDRERPQ